MKFNFQISKALSILVLTILSMTRTHAQIIDDAITDIVNSGQVIEVRDESYRENSKEFVKILNCELVDLSEKTYDLSWSKLFKVKTVLRNEKLIAKSIKKNILIPSIDYHFSFYSSETYSNQINEKIAKGKLSYDKDFLNLSEITWITEGVEWEKAVNRVGYSITYSTGQTNHDALVLKLNKQWLVFNLSDTLQTNKEKIKIEYENIQHRNRRNAFITQLNKDYSSDLTRFFKDTSIYIFEIPRGLITYNKNSVQQFTEGIELVTYQLTNDSLWFMNTFKSDTAENVGYESYSKAPNCIGKVKLQDVYASGGIDISEMKGSKLYTLNSWSDLMYQAKDYPEKYAKAMHVMDEQEEWINQFKERSTDADYKYTEYQRFYRNIPLSDWSPRIFLKLIKQNPTNTKTLIFSYLERKYEVVDFKPNVYKRDPEASPFENPYKVLDTNEFVFNGESYNRRFDTFIPFKTKPVVNEFLTVGYNDEGITVSDTINAQKLIAVFLYNIFLEVASSQDAAEKRKEEQKKEEAETAKRIAEMNAKYGEKYVKAAKEMKIIVGMHKDLVNLIVNQYYTVGSTSSSSSGDYYRLDPRYGTGWVSVWIKNKKVSGVTYH